MDANITGMHDQSDRLQKVICRIRDFRDQRDWMQFHNPKNLAASIVIEAAELLEHFQWKTPDESEAHAESRRDSVADEIADVVTFACSPKASAISGHVITVDAGFAARGYAPPVIKV